MFSLENEFLSIKVKSKGGELSSIMSKSTGTEYLWCGDSTFWGGQSPTLFPTVGKVKNNQYSLEGKVYPLTNHGFARHSEFNLAAEDSNSVTFELPYSEETLKVYPYKFRLQIIYSLEGSSIKISYRVVNEDNKDIYFSIGAHPAFNCPLSKEESMSDYYFEFEKEESTSIMTLTSEGYFKRELSPYLKEEKIITISEDLFKKDALVFHDLKSKSIALKNKNNNKAIKVDFDELKWLGLWSKGNGAPFVCIEPWLGHGDYVDFEGDFREREGVMCLAEGKEFSCSYRVHIIE